jgi:hypothetical protein
MAVKVPAKPLTCRERTGGQLTPMLPFDLFLARLSEKILLYDKLGEKRMIIVDLMLLEFPVSIF